MFEFIRTHTRLMLGFMLLLIIPSFIFFGVDGYTRSADGSNATVAKVDGTPITAAEWNLAHQRYVERARQQSPAIEVRQLDTAEARLDTLDNLLRERVLLTAARQLHLEPSDARLLQLFRADPRFAGLRNPDGTVNRDLLALQGLSSEGFAQQLRLDFAVQQVMNGVAQTALVPASFASVALDALMERREIQIERFSPASYRSKVTPTDAEIEAFHKENEALFRAPEQASIEYVTLDLDALTQGLSVPEEDLRKYYAENASRYTAAEERRASHILIAADKGSPAAERQKARERAEALLAEVRKNPAQFAELARKNSDDTGSAAQGGDLDFFRRGAMVKPFEDAAFAMKGGEISPVIETDFGYHIIRLTDVRGGTTKPFEEVRAQIEVEVRRSLAQRKYAEAAEQFTNTVYEQSDSLQPVIDKLKLSKKSATVQRTPAVGATGPLASAKLLEAVFGNDAVRSKRNTDAVEVGPNQLAAARITEYQPARTLRLDEVKEGVRERLIAQRSAALARQEGEAKLAALKLTPDVALPTVLVLSRGQAQGAPRAVMDAVLRADPAKLPNLVGVDLAEQGYVVLRVLKVLPRETPPGGDAPLRAQLTQAVAAAEGQAYLEALKKRYQAALKPNAAAMAAAAASAGGR